MSSCNNVSKYCNKVAIEESLSVHTCNMSSSKKGEGGWVISASETENPAATLVLAAWRYGGKLHVHMREDVMRAV